MKRVVLLFGLLCMYFYAFSQFSLSGKIVDAEGNPLAGANVILSSTYNGTMSGFDGHFVFRNLKKGAYSLKVTFIGFNPYLQEISIESDHEITVQLKNSDVLTDEVIISSTRASNKTPVAYTNVDEEEINSRNLGQDVPILLKMTPSMVTTSDAGTGIGYTDFRIRGTSANRINITVNGIPLNDAESHGVWWVNMPDFSSSVDNIQVQRGVGTSTNGSAAFGATINLQTLNLDKNPYAEINTSYGSFNSLKTNINVGTGLIKDRFSLNARLSKISSDGYIDRGSADLQSYYISGAYYTDKSLLKVNLFSGHEVTYQAWDGISSDILEYDREYNGIGEYTDDNGETRYYDNEVDDYKQTHFQLLYARELSRHFDLNLAAHYTQGEGYYEQYKEDESFSDYNLEDVIVGEDTITETDLIRRKWLDNDFYGFTYSLNYRSSKLTATIGGSWNHYLGDHFGTVIWAKYASNSEIRHRWYESDGDKADLNLYAKANYQVARSLNIYGDIQYRHINYSIDGIDDDLRDITQEHTFDFINPKLGIYYQLTDKQNMYFSFAVGNREPNRSNYTDADPSRELPVAETLYDYELGYNFRTTIARLSVNVYYMDYKDQLVLTGQINDVGSSVMENVPESYRAGIEIVAGIKPVEKLQWEANITLSKNKIKNFTEYVDNWDYWSNPDNEVYQVITNLGETDLSFSPSVIAGSSISYKAFKNFDITFLSKYVGKQYIDNTSSNERKLDSYFVHDIRLSYDFSTALLKQVSIQLLVNNVFNEEYETNAWVYRYYSEGTDYVYDGYYPQAGTNFLAGITLRF